MIDTPSNTPPNHSRRQLVLMLVIVAVTLGGSYLLFVLAQGGNLWGTVNKGEFVRPTTAVTDFDWRTVESAPFSREFPAAFATQADAAGNKEREQVSAPEQVNGREQVSGRESVQRTWWLLAVANDGCDADCVDALQHMRSLQVLLTKDATRLRRALVTPNPAAEQLSAEYPRLKQLSREPQSEAPANGIYIVDPTGVLVLRYPLVGSAADIQKDLKRLLKYSQLG